MFGSELLTKFMLRIIVSIRGSEDLFAVSEMRDLSIADFDLDGHPLVAMESLFDIGWRTELAVVTTGKFDVRAGDAQLTRWTIFLTIAPVKVEFHTHRKLLLQF